MYKQLGYTDKLVATQILGPLNNFKIPPIVKLITFRHQRAKSEVAEMSSWD
jgi:hypothetical protein